MQQTVKRFLTIGFCLCMLSVLTVRGDVLGEYSFIGTLGDKIPVRLKFAVNGDEIAVGEIYYPKAKNPAPILVVGKMMNDGWFSLEEYQEDGTITGSMVFKIEGEDHRDGAYIAEGSWTNPRTDKSLPMKNFRTNEDPETGPVDITKYFDYEDPQNIGREYAFKVWHRGYNDYMGGHASFRGAGKWKLHFEIVNVRNNIAEGKSEPGRPAVLGEITHNFFEYTNVNECGYGFKACFFKRFVVLITTTDYETLGCFGAHSAFDGVYMKVKQ